MLRLGQPDVFDILLWHRPASFDNLALIFAIGIAIGLQWMVVVRGLAGAIGYLVMKNSIDALSKGYSTAELQGKLSKVQDLIGNSANVIHLSLRIQ